MAKKLSNYETIRIALHYAIPWVETLIESQRHDPDCKEHVEELRREMAALKAFLSKRYGETTLADYLKTVPSYELKELDEQKKTRGEG